MTNRIAKNTAFMTAASIGQKLISFAYFALVARMIGAEGMGKYFLALSFTTIFVVFVDLGFSNVLVREAAKSRDKAQEFFSNVLAAKVGFGILSYASLVLVVNLLDYSSELKNLIYLSGVTMLLDSLHLSAYSVFRALGNLKYEAIGVICSQLLTVTLGSIFLLLRLPLIFLIFAFTISSFVNVCFSSFFLYVKYEIKLVPAFNRQILIYLGKIAVPFGLASIFARVYTYIDSILLSKMAGEVAVGWYSIPHKIVQAFLFIPGSLVAVLYPRFSELFVADKKKLAYIFERGLKYLLLIAFPIALGIGILAEDIILSLFGDQYVNSVLPLQILLIGLLFSFCSYLTGAFLNACNRQVAQTVIAAFVMIVNIFLNLLLIPRYGITGAAVAAVLSNVILVLFGYSLIPNIIKISHVYVLKNILRLTIASLLMGTIVWWINMYFTFMVAIAAGMVSYPALLYFSGAISPNQLKEAVTIFLRR